MKLSLEASSAAENVAVAPPSHSLSSPSRSSNPRGSAGCACVMCPMLRVPASCLLFATQILGTHQGSIVPEHLQSYLEEFTFRFNRRTSNARGLVFRRLLEQAVVTGPITEANVTHGYNWMESQGDERRS